MLKKTKRKKKERKRRLEDSVVFVHLRIRPLLEAARPEGSAQPFLSRLRCATRTGVAGAPGRHHREDVRAAGARRRGLRAGGRGLRGGALRRLHARLRQPRRQQGAAVVLRRARGPAGPPRQPADSTHKISQETLGKHGNPLIFMEKTAQCDCKRETA